MRDLLVQFAAALLIGAAWTVDALERQGATC